MEADNRYCSLVAIVAVEGNRLMCLWMVLIVEAERRSVAVELDIVSIELDSTHFLLLQGSNDVLTFGRAGSCFDNLSMADESPRTAACIRVGKILTYEDMSLSRKSRDVHSSVERRRLAWSRRVDLEDPAL